MPVVKLATQRPDIQGLMREYTEVAEEFGYIAHDVLPVLEVQKQSGSYGILPIEELKKKRDPKRSLRAKFGRSEHDFRDEDFACIQRGWEEPVDYSEADMFSEYDDRLVTAGEICQTVILDDVERDTAASVQDTSVWTGSALTTAVGTSWRTRATSKPIEDVSNAILSCRASCGMVVKEGVCVFPVFENLRHNASIIDRISASGSGDKVKPNDINLSMIAQVLGLKKLHVAGAMYDSAAEGLSAAMTDIWDPDFFSLILTANGKNELQPCVGRTFHWSQNGSMPKGVTESYGEPQSDSEVIRVKTWQQAKIHYPECGHLLTGVNS